jgi:quercetin dioxygenase-like cupin family protein/alkylhydroperoxidase/carboxymuconolactone decarboxylase family protein YurZ
MALVISLFSITQNIRAQDNEDRAEVLTDRQKHIIPISAFTAKGDQENLEPALKEGLDAGLTINEIKEVLVHLYAYTGFPRSLNALGTFQSVVEDRKERGIQDKDGPEASPLPANKTSEELGSEVLVELVGTSEASGVREFTPVLDQFLKEHLFGDIFGRDVLSYEDREIVTISALASMTGVQAQLGSHLNVARNIGFSEEQLKKMQGEMASKVGWQEGRIMTETLKTTLDIEIEGNENQVGGHFQKAFPKGNKIDSENFTGKVWVNMLAPNDTTHNISMGNVTFAPGARSNWHIHPGGQILMITKGKGWYQEEGKRVRTISAGEVIKCPPNIRHWHGATPKDSMTHTAISTNIDKGGVVWQEPVDGRDYSKNRIE